MTSFIIRAGLCNVSNMWVPKDASEEILSTRIELCAALTERHKNDPPFLDRIIFEGEKFIYYNKYKQHFKHRNVKKKLVATEAMIARSGLKPHKIVLHLWWTRRGVVMYKLIGDNMRSRDHYEREIDELKAELEDNPSIVGSDGGGPILYHNSDRYLDEEINAKIANYGWEQVIHPKLCPDLTPTDYKILQNFQYTYNCTLFSQLEQVEEFVFKYFESKNVKFFQDAIDSWPMRWSRVISTGGEYIATNEKQI